MDREAVAKHNIIAMTLEGTLFWTGLSFMEGNTVVSLFINEMTGSLALSGLAFTLRSSLFLMGQVIFGMFLHKVRVQSRFMRTAAFLSRPVMLLMLPFLLSGMSGPPAAYLFLFLYGYLFFADGFVGLTWTETLARTVPLRERGMIISYQQAFSGMMGLMSGLVIQRVLGSAMSAQYRFSILFGLSAAMMILDAFVICRFKDFPHPSYPERPVPSLRAYFGGFVPLFQKPGPFRRIILCRVLYALTLVSLPLNILMGRDIGGITAVQQSALVYMPIFGQIIAGFLWSRLSLRRGYPFMMVVAAALSILCALISLFCLALSGAGMSMLIPLGLVMLLMTVNTPAYMCYTQHMVANVSEEERALYMVLTGILVAPTTFGAVVAGAVVQRAGYLPVFVFMLVCALALMAVTLRSFFWPQSKYYDPKGENSQAHQAAA